jgi:microcystin-dependent protein
LPQGWDNCDGGELSRTLYPELFAVIGTNFGPGDGSTTFNKPDFRGRTIIGQGQGAGLTNRTIGQKGGEEKHQLTVAELAAHAHTQVAHHHTFGTQQTTTGSGEFAGSGTARNTSDVAPTINPAGGDLSHENMPPFGVALWMIKVSPGGGQTATAPIADTLQDGLLRRVSGLATDFVDGTNHCQNLGIVRLRSFNSIGNPNFEITQYRVGAAIANPPNGARIEDRWFVNNLGLQFTAQDLTPTSPILLPGTNFPINNRYIRITVSTAKPTLAAGDVVAIYQQVEGPLWRELSTDVHSVSLLVRASVAVTFGLSLRDSGSPPTKSLTKLCTYTSPNTWVLIPLPNLPIWVSGGNFNANPGAISYLLALTLAGGSTYMSPANDTWQNGNFMGSVGQDNFFANAAGATFDIAFVQHEPGPLCTTPIDKPFPQNYDECLRYFAKSYNYGDAIGLASSAGYISQFVLQNSSVVGGLRFPKPMAKTPIVSAYSAVGGANAVYDASALTNRAVSGVYGATGQTGFGGFNISTVNAAVAIYQWHYIADTTW